MWNIKKYSAMAIVGAGLAFAAASPASACGAFGMAGWPVFGAAFGGCGAYGYAAPVAYAYVPRIAYGCAPVAYGCGGYGAYGYAPTFGYAPAYGMGGYGYGGCGCGHVGYHPRAFGYAVAFHRPIGFAMAFRRHIGYGVAFHHPMRTYAAYRSYRPSRYAAYTTRSYHRHLYASYGMKHRYAMRHGVRTQRA